MATKLFHLLTMTWMVTWRSILVNFILMQKPHLETAFPIALAISVIFIFIFNRTLLTWPIARLFSGMSPVGKANIRKHPWPKPQPKKPAEPRPDQPVEKTATPPEVWNHKKNEKPLDTATENGRITGFEPRQLEQQPVPTSTRYHNMQGEPGAGLVDAAGLDPQSILLGIKGEQNFARALAVTNQLQRFRTIWSVPVPQQNRLIPASHEADIDCVIITGAAVYLIDLKNYKSGNVTYFTETQFNSQIASILHCSDKATYLPVGEPKKLSINMDTATKAMQSNFPTLNIIPVVVFMPTNKGEADLYDVNWPGNIPATNLSTFLRSLSHEPDYNGSLQPVSSGIENLCHLKDQERAAQKNQPVWQYQTERKKLLAARIAEANSPAPDNNPN